MNKFLSILGLCRRAGKLSMGYDSAVISIKEGKAKLVIVADGISAKTEKNALFEADRKNVKLIKCPYTTEEISSAIGKKAGVLAVLDENFAKGLDNEETNVRRDEVYENKI